MLRLVWRHLLRRPLRSALALVGLAMSIAVLASLSAFGRGYQHALHTELDRMGMQLMLVPIGCPYDAAAQVLKGRTLDNSLPESVLLEVQHSPEVAVAAPLLIAAVPRPREGRSDVWVGIDRSAPTIKSWWRIEAGAEWFEGSNSVILGSEAASSEWRKPGDKIYSPEAGRSFVVSVVLGRSGTSDDHLFFLPLDTAQSAFGMTNRLTAIAVQLRDPGKLYEETQRLQRIPGAQVVTVAEMMGTFLNLVGSVRALLRAVATVAVTLATLSVFNTLLAAVIEYTGELALFRAIGASRLQIFLLLTLESLVLTFGAVILGLILAGVSGRPIERIVKWFVPMPPSESMFSLTPGVIGQSLALGIGIGLLAVLYPAWQAVRIPPARILRGE